MAFPLIWLHFARKVFFVIGTDVKREFTGLTIDEIYKEIDILKNPAGR